MAKWQLINAERIRESENPHLEDITEIIDLGKKYQWVKTEERDEFYIISECLPMKYSWITEGEKATVQERKPADLKQVTTVAAVTRGQTDTQWPGQNARNRASLRWRAGQKTRTGVQAWENTKWTHTEGQTTQWLACHPVNIQGHSSPRRTEESCQDESDQTDEENKHAPWPCAGPFPFREHSWETWVDFLWVFFAIFLEHFKASLQYFKV